ncbi:hypothetical protein Isop_2390 [Isosphaera pallida ATCC 43644]|uniref:DUF4276 family protein n=1 Tax=Isosphaera pallida (strain ATCC 43644 / DSM 9630 / IS1B) TaxID=575540 RepID=E8QWR6_ISOPI|nr:hypothetical protein Isop_2390 [Isosphaera pallida ATCC 43644]
MHPPKLVILVEERSMADLLNQLLPIVFPELPFQTIPHSGKRDLKESIPRKLKGWNEPNARFLILCDNDSSPNCRNTKEKLQSLCPEDRRNVTKIRIVCQELEAWYVACPEALALAYKQPQLEGIAKKKGFRQPDAIRKPSESIRKLIPEFSKLDGAKRIAPHLAQFRDVNRSSSFQAFLNAVESLMDDIPRPSLGG